MVDAGGLLTQNAMIGSERPGEVSARIDLVGKLYAQLGYAALNVGAHELAAGLPELRRFAKIAKLQLISANLVDAKTEAPPFERYLLRQIGPLKVALIGVMTSSPNDRGRLIDEQGLRVQEPTTALRNLVPELRKQGAELIVVLSQLRRAELEGLANQVPGIDMVLGSMDMELTMQPITVGRNTLFVDAFSKGKYVVDVALSLRGRRDRFFVANLREAKLSERADAARQVQDLTSQLEDADRPDGALKLVAETRKVMEAQLTGARAKLQRLTYEVENAETQVPADASTIELEAAALASSVVDDPPVDKLIKAFQEKYPKLGGH
ncbi:MAG: hypothetical protein EXR77_12790 [Myxococcales bacterium]|nr:hypothetical protein [Myxococcales bacterium]